jgi:hypothetical protein
MLVGVSLFLCADDSRRDAQAADTRGNGCFCRDEMKEKPVEFSLTPMEGME